MDIYHKNMKNIYIYIKNLNIKDMKKIKSMKQKENIKKI